MIKQNRYFPLLDGLMEVNATTKKKQGFIKVAVPDELINNLMKRMMDKPMDISNITIGYQDSNFEDFNPCAKKFCESCKHLEFFVCLKGVANDANGELLEDIDTFGCTKWEKK